MIGSVYRSATVSAPSATTDEPVTHVLILKVVSPMKKQTRHTTIARNGANATIQECETRRLLSTTYFGAPQTYATPNTIAPVIVDVNGDGKPDLLSLVYGVAVRLNNGDGTFAAPHYFAVGNGSYALCVADVNNDGAPDAVVANGEADAVSVLLGNGDGTFGSARVLSVGAFFDPVDLAVADINGDGNADLVVCDSGSFGDEQHGVSIFLGNGDGTFQSSHTLVTNNSQVNPESISIVDVNGDGKSDLIVGLQGYSHVFPGNGDGSFDAYSFAYAGDPIGATDFNHDGNVDIVGLGVPDYRPYDSLGDGDGNFSTTKTITYLGPTFCAADIDEDGSPDIVSSYEVNDARNELQVDTGDGDGTFTSTSPFQLSEPGERVDGIAVGDLNGDGNPDLVVVQESGTHDPGVISVFMNTSGAMPLLSITNTNRTLTATASGDRPDDILLSRTGGIITLSDSGDVTTYKASDLDQININTGDGNDVVIIEPGIGLPVSVNGGAGHDILRGHGPNITLAGGKGWDSIQASGHADLLIGGLGNDTILAGPTPTDTLRGGAGDDYLSGGGLLIPGTGNDTLLQS